ncbi:optineurin isoform X2 [Cloeon dipterum]|uniref:optineurin isoform X2 n=1 Tax=Cloeon dipterum TaxID=197152 RepID=UPI00322012A1
MMFHGLVFTFSCCRCPRAYGSKDTKTGTRNDRNINSSSSINVLPARSVQLNCPEALSHANSRRPYILLLDGVMVKPNSSLVNGQSNQQLSLNAGSMNSNNSDSLSSFIIVDEPTTSNMSSLTSVPQNSSLSLDPEDLPKKLEVIMKENAELKEVLQQNNLAMKQQCDTLSKWHEEVLQVHKSHKDKFEEMKLLIVKLKTEKEGLLKKLQSQENILSENQELKTKLQKLDAILEGQQEVLKENELSKQRVAQLEKQCCQAQDVNAALEKAEIRIKKLADKRLSEMLEKEELQHRVNLLQQELAEMQADGFVMVSHDVPKTTTNKEKDLPHPEDKLKKFYAAVDKYDESIMNSFKVLEQQVTSFVTVYNWLDETRAKLPGSSAGLSEMGTLLEMISLSLREAQKSSAGQRQQMEEASQQLGRLGSDFQTLLEEFMSLSNDVKNKKPEPEQPAAPAPSSASFMELEKQLEGAKEQLQEMEGRLNVKDRIVSQLHARLRENENEIAELAAQQKSEQSKEFKEQLDHKIAEILQMKDVLEEKERTLEKKNSLIAQKDSQLAQMELRVSQAETKSNQKEAEAATMLQRMKTLEQSVDALQAQAEVYKMDFNEERESREKLAADKEKLADELLAVQQEKEHLAAELEALKRQPTQLPPTASASNVNPKTQHTNYNTIAAIGRPRSHWLSDALEQPREQPKYECPKCYFVFNSLQPLENHVNLCLDQDMYP